MSKDDKPAESNLAEELAAIPELPMGQAWNKLAAARVHVQNRAPYLGAGLWRMSLRIIAAKDWPKWLPGFIFCDTLGRVSIHSGLIAKATLDQLAGGLCHELWHLLLRHFERQGGRHGALFNIAGDCAIHTEEWLKAWQLPYQGATPKQAFRGAKPMPEGLSAEGYYALLVNQMMEQQAQAGKLQDGTGAPMPRCGAAAGGRGKKKGEGESEDGEGEGCGFHPDWQGIAEAVARAAQDQAAKNPGSVPGDLLRWAGDLIRPRNPWQRILAAKVKSELKAMGCGDYTYSQPSRRQQPGDAIRPSMRWPIINAAIVFDTSGSMGASDLAEGLGDVYGIIRQCGARVSFYATDAAVAARGRISTLQQALGLLKGGGGTNMGVGLDAAWGGNPRPGVVIVITDGFTPWPEAAAGPTIVVVPEGGPPTPAWAKRVERPGASIAPGKSQ